MDNFGARHSFEMQGAESGPIGVADPSEFLHADDPLGDEAAFPMTWQHLAAGDPPRD